MKTARVLGFLIIIALIFITGLYLILSSNPSAFWSIVDIETDNPVSQDLIDRVNSDLDIGKKASLVTSEKTIISRGESIEAKLGILNRLDSQKNFYISTKREAGPNDSPYLIHQEMVTLDPSERKIIEIGIITNEDTPYGLYTYSINVCQEKPCSDDAASPYYTRTMSFEVGW